MEGQGQSFFGGSGGFFGGVSLLDDRQTLQQKRDEYIIDIRRQERMSLLENNKKVCQEFDETGERQLDSENLDLSYLNHLPNAEELKAHIEVCLKEDFDFAKIPLYVKMVTDGDLMQKHTGIILLRKCLTQQNTPIQQVIDLGVVPYLVNLIQDDTNPHLQIEATWCITNLAVGDTNQTRTLVQKGVIQIYVQMLRKQNTLLLEQIVWGIGNISGDCIEFRDMVIKSGAMINLVSLYEKIKDSHPRLREQLVWTASNICRQKPAPDINRVQSGIRMFAEELKLTSKPSTLIDCCWGLAQCCRLETLKYFVEAKILNKLSQLMFSPQLMISQPSLRIIGVFTNGDDQMCQMVIEENGLAGLEHNLNNTTKAVRKEALWAISNITAGNQSQIGAVLSRNSLVEKLFTIAVTDAVENQVEAIWSLCNATKNASFEQVQFLLSKNLLDLFASNLGLTVDNKILNVVLESLYVISEKIKAERAELMPSFIDTLYNKQIAQKVSNLQEHSHNLVYKKSYKFITEFLEVEEPY